MTQLSGIAQILAAQGRHGDTLLLHISPAELIYLQYLAKKQGKTLTINPKTGLPEAFKLSDAIGPLVGIGLSLFAPELSPLMSGLISGIASGAATGHWEKGILGGLLGGGLNSIMGDAAMMPALDSSVGVNAAEALPSLDAAKLAGENAVTQHLADSGMLDPAGNAPINYSELAPNQQEIYNKAFQDSYGSNYDTNAGPTNNLSNRLSNVGSGLSQAFQSPLDFYKQNKGALGAVGVGALGLGAYNQTLAQQQALKNAANGPNANPLAGWDLYTRPGTYQGVPIGGYPNFYDPRIIGTASTNLGTAFSSGGLARGGIANYRKSKKMHFAPMPDAVSDKGHHRSITQALRSLYESKASAASDLTNPDSPVSKMGIAGVHDPLLERAFHNAPPVAMSHGRFIEGPGDGLSDSVKANIDGQQEARLADGEFVVPADAVSDIGNGSSKAGAKKLMAVVHHVRKKRHGTTKQPGPV